jgi:hypothetical protein
LLRVTRDIREFHRSITFRVTFLARDAASQLWRKVTKFRPTITLNDRKIARLKPTGTQIDYFDRSFPGLGVRVSQQGRKTFMLLYRTPSGS